MKNKLLLLALLTLPFLAIFATESETSDIFRGIDFSVTEVQKVKAMSITVPKIAKRSDSLHMKDKFPITFFKADCIQEKECFSLLIAVSVIPESLKSYETLVEESRATDFGNPPYEVNKWVELLTFKTEKTKILMGPGELLGTKINAFYFMKDTNETYRVTINLIYHPKFPEEEWKDILMHSFLILNSVNIASVVNGK
ncbi:hypothetical protein [Leptospira kanakyensis]|uniref:Uncharacterized protein n=1 Tax=Leptospira kanakyensis TaxID=2484968 RepID=A0A6N4QDQ2_9LEPT|nr:hypothetical protein [Leptospira kanakyensis]MCW7480266.1 hypothetical protein [Leptospira kanakyensis]TGK50460.1 hypothetical protein EHQ11_12305 [Leptospira kanakyensis]TGK63939.1 hypothetical protein EHQ16_05715 [Leptospira kanakyensis]TGK69598.1 hypothetical protein EHQ18_12465 [Leptospira kanakyensis]